MSSSPQVRDTEAKATAFAPPSPQLFFDTINAYQRTEALKSAIELDLFTAIDDGHNTAASLAKQLGAAERGVRILCDYLTMVGFLTKQDLRYALTPDSAMFLSRKSPACLNSAVRFLSSPALTDHFKQLTAAVRKGGTVSGEGSVEPEHPMWVDFARGMAPMMQLPAQMIAQVLNAEEGKEWKVLDIAAGHGTFGITIAKKNPNAKSQPSIGKMFSRSRKRTRRRRESPTATTPLPEAHSMSTSGAVTMLRWLRTSCITSTWLQMNVSCARSMPP
jgi:hypothetical protein